MCESRGEDAIRCELSYMYMYHIYSADAAMQNKARVSINSLTTRDAETRFETQFANSVNLDEVAHDEPPYPDLHCLSSSL